MTKPEWKRRIVKSCKEAGTYEKHFDAVIDTLADIMETRDTAHDMFVRSGARPVVQYTNKGGHENPIKNPALVMVMELNSQALAYWRDLGLTPAGLKKLNADVVKDNSVGVLEKVLMSLE